MISQKAKLIARTCRLVVGVPIVGAIVAAFAWELYWMDPEERSDMLDELLAAVKAGSDV